MSDLVETYLKKTLLFTLAEAHNFANTCWLPPSDVIPRSITSSLQDIWEWYTWGFNRIATNTTKLFVTSYETNFRDTINEVT